MTFERVYRDATDEDNVYQCIELDDTTFNTTGQWVRYQSDVPDISNCKTKDEVVFEFEVKGWVLSID